MPMTYETVLHWIESNPLFYRLALALLFVILSFPLGWLLKKAIHVVRSRLLSRTETSLDERLAEVLEKRTKSIAFAILSLYALWEIQMATDGYSVAVVRIVKIIDAVLYIYAALVGIGVAIGFIRVTIEYLLESAAQSHHQDIDDRGAACPEFDFASGDFDCGGNCDGSFLYQCR